MEFFEIISVNDDSFTAKCINGHYFEMKQLEDCKECKKIKVKCPIDLEVISVRYLVSIDDVYFNIQSLSYWIELFYGLTPKNPITGNDISKEDIIRLGYNDKLFKY